MQSPRCNPRKFCGHQRKAREVAATGNLDWAAIFASRSFRNRSSPLQLNLHPNRQRRSTMKIALSLFALAALTAAPFAASAQTVVQVTPSVEAPVVTVSATESVDAAPDVAIVSAGVSTLAPTAVAALSENSVKMTRMVTAVRAAGVAERDIQTRGISINAEYVYVNNAQQFRGYRASNTVSIRSRDIPGLGRFLDALVAAGSNQIEGPSFTIDKPGALMMQARGNALISAQANADTLARQAGFKRARLLALSENSNQRFGRELRTFDAEAPSAVVQTSAPVVPGEVATTVTVTGTYRLEN